jgi:hypothetical protein
MKKPLVLVLLSLCFAACNVFFSNNTGEEGTVSLSLGEGGAYTGVFDGSVDFGGAPTADGQPLYPDLGNPRIAVYDASGKALRSSTFSGGSLSWDFSLPAGGPYWVDFSAPVQHPAAPQEDPFPFVKTFGATVKIDRVDPGSTRDLLLPLRVRETAIMAPYTREKQTGVFAPFYDLPIQYPDRPIGTYVDRGNVGADDLSLDFDPYGRLITTVGNSERLYRIENFNDSGRKRISSEFNVVDFNAVAFNLQNGELYISSAVANNKFDIGGVPANWFDGVLNWFSGWWSKGLSSPYFTIDEEGAFYTISGGKIYRTAHGSQSASFDIADIIDPAGQEWDEANVVERTILDLKALNGYLYILLFVLDKQGQYYDYFAAVPVDAIKREAVKGAAWFAGGRSVDQLDEGYNTDPYSRKGFFGPKKIVGWGPERVYVYDLHGVDHDGFHRIVEVDIGSRGISKAGLVVKK